MPLPAGTRLGPYEIVTPLGAGGMGEVYRARDGRLDRDVAIKVLPRHLSASPEVRSRFQREAKTVSSLNHPHICTLFDVGREGDTDFLVMELVDGETLADRIAKGALPPDHVLKLGAQISDALDRAHRAGVIHRDLKPGNVMLTKSGAKLMDFGLARATGLAGPSSSGVSLAMTQSPTMAQPLTAEGTIVGTFQYMAPEQLEGKEADARSDLWSLGCVLYEMATGKRAFEGATQASLISAIMRDSPRAMSELVPMSPPALERLVRQCIAKDPDERWQSAGDVRRELEWIAAGSSQNAPAVASRRWGRSRTRILAFTVATAIGMALGAGLWSLLGPHGGATQPRCVTVTIPPGVTALNVAITRDGSTLLVRGQPKNPEGSESPQPRLYARRLDRYEFKELAGTEGLLGFGMLADNRSLIFVAPVSPGAPQKRVARMPLDGSSPATTIGEWKDTWSNVTQARNGDLLIQEGSASFVRLPSGGGSPSSPVKIDAGRPGVSFYEIKGEGLPGNRGALVNVVAYDARGWHYSAGVLNVRNGKVKVVEEDGGNPKYSPTGHLLFSRGDVVLAVPFDLGRLEARGAPVAVWSGLSTAFTVLPGGFQLTGDGALFYRPGQAGGDRHLAILDVAGKIEPWSTEQWAVDAGPEPSPDGRRVACSIVNARGIDEIWISDLAHPGFQRLGTDANADCFWPLWSPDGRRITYRRVGRDERDGIYIQDAEGGEAKRIFKPESPQINYTAVSWLPDGSALVLWREESGKSRLAMLPFAEGEADTSRLRPLLPSAFRRYNPRLSRDGRVLAFGSDESGKGLTYVAELRPDGSAGRPIEVRTSGSFGHLFSADGKVLYVEDDRHRLMKVAITTAPTLSVSAPTEVCDFEKLGVAMWTLLPDGRLFLGLKNDNEGQITRYNLVLNWTEELKRKMRAAR